MTDISETPDPYAVGSPILVRSPVWVDGYGCERRTVVRRTRTQFTDDQGVTWVSRTGRRKGDGRARGGRGPSVSAWSDDSASEIAAYKAWQRACRVATEVDAVTVRAVNVLFRATSDFDTLAVLDDMIDRLATVREEITKGVTP